MRVAASSINFSISIAMLSFGDIILSFILSIYTKAPFAKLLCYWAYFPFPRWHSVLSSAQSAILFHFSQTF